MWFWMRPAVAGQTFDNREELLQAVLAARSAVKDLHDRIHRHRHHASTRTGSPPWPS